MQKGETMYKKQLIILMVIISLLSSIPYVLGVSVGSGVTPTIETEDFAPIVWLCDSRVVYDDATEPGRFSDDGEELLERINNYAFEGEQIFWTVLVFDKNGIEKIEDVFVTLGSTQGAGNDIEANCAIASIINDNEDIDRSCNARILEEEITDFSENVAAYYDCEFTVETAASMYGEYWVTIEATDLDGLSG